MNDHTQFWIMSINSKVRRLAISGSSASRIASAVPVLMLGSALPLLAQEGGEGGGGGLFAINYGLVVWTWLIFVLLLLVLRKWAWRPILDALDQREKGIQNALDQAAREREEAAKLLGQQREILGQVRGEAQEILAEGRKAGERLRAELMAEAQKQKQEILERSREEILRERDEALATLRREAVDLSISAADCVLEKNLDSKDNRRLVEEYLEALSKEDGWDR